VDVLKSVMQFSSFYHTMIIVRALVLHGSNLTWHSWIHYAFSWIVK